MGFLRRASRRIALFAAIVLIAATSGLAGAQTVIDPNTSEGPVPDYDGSGLFGLYNITSGNSAYTGSTAPLASFMTTNVCFPDCLESSFSDGAGGFASFSNGNATDITPFNPDVPLPTTWNNSQLTLSGYIAIDTPGTYSFSLGHDDAASLSIGFEPIANAGCCGVSGPYQVSFSAAGLYSIALTFTEVTGGSYFDLTATDPTGSCLLGCYVDNQLQPNTLFYSDNQLDEEPAPVPKPGAGSLSLVVALGTMVAMRARAERRRGVTGTAAL
jgi:hypothetical protein